MSSFWHEQSICSNHTCGAAIQKSRRIIIVPAKIRGKFEGMKKLAIGCGVLVVLGVIVIVIIAIAGGSYNRLVRLSQQTDSTWAQVQADYQRRADLIPNLVATVSGAANFEKSTL